MSNNQTVGNKLITILGTFLALLATNVYACDAKIQSLNLQQSSDPHYDIFSSEAYALTQQYEAKIQFTNINEDELCRFYIAVSTLNNSHQLTSGINTSLTFEAIPQSFNSGIRNNYWYAVVSPDNDTFKFQLRFPGKQFAPQGNYTGILEAKLMASLSSTDVVDERKESIYASIDSAAQVSFYGVVNNTYHLDLGTLTTGKIITAFPNLYIKSTTDFSLSFKSTNKGALRHENHQQQWDIDYQLRLNDTEINLNTEGKQFYVNSPTTNNGLRIPLKIIVGNTEQKPSGTYSDEIHIYISPGGFGHL